MRQALLLGCKRYMANELAMADLELTSQPLQQIWHDLDLKHSLTRNAEEGPEI